MSMNAAALDVTPASVIPSMDVFQRQLQQTMPSRTLYCGADDWVEIGFAGDTIFFPPDLGGKLIRHKRTGQMVPADGTVVVKTRFGHLRDEQGHDKGYGPVPGQTAEDVVMFCARYHLHEGVVALFGDESDEARKALSRKLWLSSRLEWARQQVEARNEVVQKHRKNPSTAGLPDPPATKNQIAAQRLLDRHAVSEEEVHEFVCEHGCAVATNDFEEYAIHMQAQHRVPRAQLLRDRGDVVDDTPVEDVAEDSAVEANPKSRGKRTGQKG